MFLINWTNLFPTPPPPLSIVWAWPLALHLVSAIYSHNSAQCWAKKFYFMSVSFGADNIFSSTL